MLRTKTLENFEKEINKNHLHWIGRREKERKGLKCFWKDEKHVREKIFKRLIFPNSIGQNWGLINQKIDLIDRAPIDH